MLSVKKKPIVTALCLLLIVLPSTKKSFFITIILTHMELMHSNARKQIFSQVDHRNLQQQKKVIHSMPCSVAELQMEIVLL